MEIQKLVEQVELLSRQMEYIFKELYGETPLPEDFPGTIGGWRGMLLIPQGKGKEEEEVDDDPRRYAPSMSNERLKFPPARRVFDENPSVQIVNLQAMSRMAPLFKYDMSNFSREFPFKLIKSLDIDPNADYLLFYLPEEDSRLSKKNIAMLNDVIRYAPRLSKRRFLVLMVTTRGSEFERQYVRKILDRQLRQIPHALLAVEKSSRGSVPAAITTFPRIDSDTLKTSRLDQLYALALSVYEQ